MPPLGQSHEEELLPCPFCGGRITVLSTDEGTHRYVPWQPSREEIAEWYFKRQYPFYNWQVVDVVTKSASYEFADALLRLLERKGSV